MVKNRTNKERSKKEEEIAAFSLEANSSAEKAIEPHTHKYGKGEFLCETDVKGFHTPEDRSPFELVVDASEGFIPLWERNTTLRWRFQERSFLRFKSPERAKTEIRQLFAEALMRWGDAVPVKFSEQYDAWDFELVFQPSDKCIRSSCTLASAFFPDAGRHELKLYPKMFKQDRKEQVDTFIHELGHVFGLRHFFAKTKETEWASEEFGTQNAFSIMNYGHKSELTEADQSDLRLLYKKVWSGELDNINGTPIKLVRPFSHDRLNLLCCESKASS